jgi:hypothetical protein
MKAMIDYKINRSLRLQGSLPSRSAPKQFEAVRYTQFCEDFGDMCAQCAFTHYKFFRNFLIRFPQISILINYFIHERKKYCIIVKK